MKNLLEEKGAWELAKKVFKEIRGYEANIQEDRLDEDSICLLEHGIIEGAKWQQEQDVSMVQSYLSANLQNIELLERSYSEEEAGKLVYNIMGEYGKLCGIILNGEKINELFEQFKKKA